MYCGFVEDLEVIWCYKTNGGFSHIRKVTEDKKKKKIIHTKKRL